MSRRHARLRLEADSYILEDLGSTNGTFVNGDRLEGERILQPGDEIAVGENVILQFNQVGLAGSPSTVRLGAAPTATMRLDVIPPAQQPQVSKAEEHQQLFTRWFEELWNKKNYAITQELVHPDFTAHGAGGQDIKQGPTA